MNVFLSVCTVHYTIKCFYRELSASRVALHPMHNFISYVVLLSALCWRGAYLLNNGVGLTPRKRLVVSVDY